MPSKITYNIEGLIGAACIALCVMGLIWSFGWSIEKSGECHHAINKDTMASWNISPPSDGKTMCDHGDDMSTLLWWMSGGLGVVGIVFLVIDFKKQNGGS